MIKVILGGEEAPESVSGINYMKITVSERAQKWYEEEMGIPEGKGIRFLGKVYGKTPVHEGFSLALAVDEPQNPIAQVEHNGILYFAEAADDWFFRGYDLEVVFDEEKQEPDYLFHENKE